MLTENRKHSRPLKVPAMCSNFCTREVGTTEGKIDAPLTM
jgi:hypothetical protein